VKRQIDVDCTTPRSFLLLDTKPDGGIHLNESYQIYKQIEATANPNTNSNQTE